MFARCLAFCLALFAVSPSALTVGPYFEVIDSEETIVFGTIAAWDRTQIVVDAQGSFQTIPLEKLVKIRNLAPSPYQGVPSANTAYQSQLPQMSGRGGANERRRTELAEAITKKLQSEEQFIKKTLPDNVIALELKDGSRLTASAFTVAKSQGVCRLLDQQNDVTFPLDSISAVRFVVRNFPEVITPPTDWQRLAVPNAEGDRLIIGNPGSFDVYAGILEAVSAETVSFTVDGETLPVPRRRVYGLVMHNRNSGGSDVGSPHAPPPHVTLALWTGTQGMTSDIELKGNDNEGELTWKTPSGIAVTVPLYMVCEIDFGEQGIASLLDFELVRSEFSLPTAQSGIVSDIKPTQIKFLQTFYESRTKSTSREMVLDGVSYNRGMTIMGKTSLEYRLPKPFAALKAVIGIEDQFRPYASADLHILGDSQVLGAWTLRGDSASQRIHVNLPQNCRTITIIAEPTPQSDVPTVLTIADPKVFE